MTHDFTTGFEGEPELFFTHRSPNGAASSLHAWEGWFDMLMEGVEPTASGWTGLALHHHLCTGWHEAHEWVDPDPGGTLCMLRQARVTRPDDTLAAFREALLSLLEAAVRDGGRFVIQRE
ncbi:MAG: hypothetical protein H6739_40800 [Alphaproteobacteria bacterium]|nr:hypothetical protein [Alphaproteobacteria bacterium]